MLFSELCFYFEKLETTSSRLALIDILSDLFKKSKGDEIDKIVYLTQGRIAPFFEAIEIGMAEKQVAQAIASAYGSTKEKALKLYGKLGDMGPVAVEMSLGFKTYSSTHPTLVDLDTDNKKSLSVREVFDVLTQIAKTSGLGTVEKRQSLFANLLRRMDGKAARYLVRIPLGNLRLGIGDPTILDGLALAKLGDKSKRKLLEGAYNRTSDLGLIATTLWDKGLSAVLRLQVIVGKPIRSELCERLPSAEKVIEKMKIVSVQPKYDGFRVQIHKDGDKVSMFSRNLENMTHMFPELIKGALRQIKAKTAILDTEALAYNPDSEEFLPFQETTKRRRKYDIEEMAKTLPLKAFAFDILYKNGKSLIDEPLSKRLKILKQTLALDDILIPAKTQTVKDAKTLNIILEDSISKGLEGVVIKKMESPYEAGGRNFNWEN
jgi:DNA ligase-1